MIAQSAALRRGFACAVAAVLVASGCAAGRDAQTANQVSTEDGTTASVGQMDLRGISVEAPTTAFYAAGSAIPVRIVMVNNGIKNDSLTNIVTSIARGWAGYPSNAVAQQAISQQTATPSATGTTSPSAPATTSPTTATPTTAAPTTAGVPSAETAVAIPAGQRVSFGVPDSKRVLVLLSSVGRVYPGSSVKITFTFAQAGSVSVQVPIQLSSSPGDNTISPAGSGDAGD